MLVPDLFRISSLNALYENHWNEDFTFQGEHHNFWEVVFVVAGEVECTEDGQIFHLKAGDILFHAPMEFHKIRSYAQTQPHVLLFSFESIGTLPKSLTDGVISLSTEDCTYYSSLLSKAANFLNNTEKDENAFFLCCAELTAFYFRLALHNQPAQNLSPSRPAQEYHKLILAMNQGVYENLTLQDIADKCTISVSYMKDLFHRYAGMSPKVYYANLRFQQALILLERGLTVQETANALQFSSSSYFSAFFKRHTGVPPAKYMRKSQE